MAGVRSVDADGLDINYAHRDEMRRAETAVDRADTEIKQAILDAFLYDPRVISFKPEVYVENGIVTLRGSVSNVAAKQAAEADAKNTLGVLRVYNYIQVDPGDFAASDETLEDRVAKALTADVYVDRYEVDVQVVDEWVYLSGDANTSYEKQRAETVAGRVSGVAGVVNNIEYEYRWEWKPDREIQADVESQLFWSPFVDSEDITVTVDNGLVMLNGTVHSWSEVDTAEVNAYQGGAKDVENHVSVDYPYYGPVGEGYIGPPPYGSAYYDPFTY